MVFYGIIAILCVLGIIVLINRAWIKRAKVLDKSICIISIFFLTVLLVFSMSKYSEYKDKYEKTKEQYLSVFNEEGEFYFIDSDGKVVKQYKSIGELIKDYFVYDVYNGNTGISKDEYKKNNLEIFIMSVLLILYWVVLLVLYEKENDFNNYEEQEDFELLDKYNPMIAACISQNRNATYKDFVAIILNFIEKGKLNLRTISSSDTDKIRYKYMISENKESNYQMDYIEKYIYDWIFEKIPDFIKNRTNYEYISINDEGIIEIDLIKRLKAFSEDEDTYFRLKEIKTMNEKRLTDLGANKKSVPFELLFLNNIIMIIVLIAVCFHIYSNGLGIHINNIHVLIALFIILFLLFILPIVYICSLIVLKMIISIFKSSEEMGEKHTGRKLLSKSFSIIITTMILMVIVMLLPIDSYLIFDVLIIGVGLLIICTDNYMLKHNKTILNDYYNLKRIENKIKDYSLMEEKNIEYVNIWDKYFVYSVALGIPLEVKKDTLISYSNIENLVLNKMDLQSIYFVCKSYFEVLWEFNFEEEEKFFKLISEIKNMNNTI